MRKEGGKVRMSNGEGWDDRGRAHSDGASVEWGLGTKQTSHTLLLIHGLHGMGLIGSSGLGLLKGDSVG